LIEGKRFQCDIQLSIIKDCSLQKAHYGITPECLRYDHRQYELIFPQPGDLDKICSQYASV
jgi:hypothetical protein